jgi:hypothetical protein
MLDPNNPRMVKNLRLEKKVADTEIPALQEKLLSAFDESGKSEFFSIKELTDSFEKVGYVPIDKIVVRDIGNKKYVVLEGNRRVSALKILKAKHDKGKTELKKDLLATMESLPAMELNTSGLSEEEVNHRISVMLGIRHHGSLLEWEPLPKSYSIYKTYMTLEPVMDLFRNDGQRRRAVANVLSITPGEVAKGLKTYVAFGQLKRELDGVQDRHFSLIQSVVIDRRLDRYNFIEYDEDTLELDDKTIENVESVCQFDVRDKLQSGQKILSRPQDVTILSRLVEKAHTAADEDTRALALKGLDEAMSGDLDPESEELRTSLRAALDCVIERESEKEWVEALDNLLDKQEIELDISDFPKKGNAPMMLGQLNESTLVQLKKILDLA